MRVGDLTERQLARKEATAPKRLEAAIALIQRKRFQKPLPPCRPY